MFDRTAGIGKATLTARDRLVIMRSEDLSPATFDLSYADLTAGQQRLSHQLGLAPGSDIDAYATAALDDTSLESARSLPDVLYAHHLITEPRPGRYLLHDLLHGYARADCRRQRVFTCRLATDIGWTAWTRTRRSPTM